MPFAYLNSPRCFAHQAGVTKGPSTTMAHTPTVKAEAIIALLSGESAHRVARRLQLPRSTIIRWRREVEQIAMNGPQKKNLSEQVEGLVTAGVESLRAQAEAISDE